MGWTRRKPGGVDVHSASGRPNVWNGRRAGRVPSVVHPRAATDEAERKAAFVRHVVPEIDVLYRVTLTLVDRAADAEDLVQGGLFTPQALCWKCGRALPRRYHSAPWLGRRRPSDESD